MRNVTMGGPLTTREIYDELFNFKESLKQLTDQFGELANGIMLSLARTERSEDRLQGEWEIVTQGWHLIRRCSNCKWEQTYSDPKYMGYEYNFCPNCGADMREMKGEPK